MTPDEEIVMLRCQIALMEDTLAGMRLLIKGQAGVIVRQDDELEELRAENGCLSRLLDRWESSVRDIQ